MSKVFCAHAVSVDQFRVHLGCPDEEVALVKRPHERREVPAYASSAPAASEPAIPARFAGALAAADLIDEYRLLVQPLVLGQGRALFDQLPRSRHMNLIEAVSFPSGIVVHIYRPQHT